jgi:hypothetical protein
MQQVSGSHSCFVLGKCQVQMLARRQATDGTRQIGAQFLQRDVSYICDGLNPLKRTTERPRCLFNILTK